MTNTPTCDFGKHKGTPYTQIPVNYLLWMVNVGHTRADLAQAELDRRGTVLPEIDISGHAIDRASQYCLDIWQEKRIGNEGLYAWLHRVAVEARQLGHTDRQGRYKHHGMKFAFDEEGSWPVLKTVIRRKKLWRFEL